MQGTKFLTGLFGIALFAIALIPSHVHASTFCTTTITNIPLSECESLYDFYVAMNGTSWTNHSGWLVDADVENRQGVTLASSAGQMHVVNIALDTNKVAGTIPASIGNLPFLVTLSLANNAIIQLPNEIGNLTALQVLDINNNDLLTLPNTWSAMDALTFADFSDNGITTLPASFTDMGALSILYMGSNTLTSLPATLSNLTTLTILDVSYNNLTALPSTFDGLTNLQNLDIRHNVISSLPSLAGLNSLTTLYASHNLLSTLPDSFGQLYSLSLADLQSNTLTSLPASINGLTTLDILYLQSNQLTTLPTEIGALDDLDTLYVQSNQLTSVPDSLGDMDALQWLLIYTNRLTSLPSAWGSLDTLKYLHAYNNTGMVGTIPSTFVGLTSLQQFYIYSNALNRTQTNYAVIPASLTTWLSGVPSKFYHGQSDITSPVVGSGGTIVPALLTGSLAYQVTINENSYAVNTGGAGLAISFTGGANCSALTTTDKFTINTGTATITITPTLTGGYENCGLYTTDHAGLRSNTLSLGSFAFGTTNDDRCYHPSVTVPESECRALFSIYSGTVGSTWTTKTNWLTSFDIESWYGVRTNVYEGVEHVDGLFLHRSNSSSDAHGAPVFWNGNNLKGALPIQMSDLPYLKDVNVSRNSALAGYLPNATTRTQLQYFYAEQDDIRGGIPTNWSGLTSMLVLSLPGNALTGSLPQGMHWNSLQLLDLNSNQIEGALPSSWSGFTALSSLSLNGNKLIGSIPQSWTAMTLLGAVNLQANDLDRNVDNLAIIPSAIQSWWDGIGSKNISNQGDITPPVLVGTGTIPWLTTGTFTYSVNVTEASYMINGFNEGLRVTFSGSTICASLLADPIRVAGQYSGVRIIPSQQGAYAGCTMTVKDHGGNISNAITLPTFAYDFSNGSICYNPALTVSQQECIVLVDMYNSMSGNQWTNTSGWLTDPVVNNWHGIQTKTVSGSALTSISRISLGSNNLRGTIPSSVGSLSFLTGIDLSVNGLSGAIPTSFGNLTGLHQINLSQNTLHGSLPASLGSLTLLKNIDLHNNALGGAIPSGFVNLTALSGINLSNNALAGRIDTFYSLTGLRTLNLSHNSFTGNVPTGYTALQTLSNFSIDHNALDRDIDHNAIMQGSLLTWYNALQTGNRSNQNDITAPTIEWTGVIQSSIAGGFTIDVDVQENSYMLDTYGSGLIFSFTGVGLCGELFSLDTAIENGRMTITIYPVTEGDYTNCQIGISDRGGNQSFTPLTSFDYSISCGDGIIGNSETCDEGSFCNNGTNCTGNPAACPTECAPRLIDDCNPLCELSVCGDGFRDADGINDQHGDYDDEFCDEGKYCDNGTDCTTNPNICQTGPSECQTRLINGCNTVCGMESCGDGTLDPDGVDDIEDNNDDEFCDDGNHNNGDGCTSLCQLEYCGDGYTDLDGSDNVADNSDDEQCDLGTMLNGKLGGVCDNSCNTPGDNCGYCYDLCNGGTGNNSLYLMIDVSGSMGNGNRLVHAKAGADAFLDLILDRQQSNTGFVTKVGLIKFNATATSVIAPTTNIQSVKTAVSTLNAGGGTNFGDPLQLAKQYFASNDSGYGHHVILLSDGLPTSSSDNHYDPEERGDYQADLLRSAGTQVYTIAVDQTDDGIEYMSHLSSSTYLNWARNQTATQETTFSPSSTYAASFGVNANKDGDEFSATANSTTTPWWQVNLGKQIVVDQVRVWNRVASNSNEFSKFWLWIKPSTFSTDNITTLKNDSTIYHSYHTGEAGRPTYFTGFLWTGRYIRLELGAASSTDNLTLSEAEVMGCPTNAASCTDGFHFQDYDGDSIETIYKHIFGAIHCGCTQEIICTSCGDGVVSPTEDCDEGSYCDDLTTNCTSDPTICTSLGVGNCEPRFSDTCTSSCEYTYCGDGVIQSPNRHGQTEGCDDGNNVLGDGCTNSCALEYCGDGYRDINGADNIWLNADDEGCDDGNSIDDDDCNNSCEWTNPVNPVDGSCNIYGGMYNFTGNGTPNAPLSGALCATGSEEDFNYTGNQRIRYCAGLHGGENVQCIEQEYRCGDGVTEANQGEECDDADNVSGDGCDSTCKLEPPLSVPVSQGMRCQSGDPVAIQSDEILPLRWQLLPVDDIDLNATSCNNLSTNTWIPGGSVTCTISIFNAQAGTAYNAQTFTGIDCVVANALTEQFTGLWDDLFTSHDVIEESVLGTLLIEDLHDWNAQRKGRYRALINSTTYTFCGRDRNGQLQPQTITYKPDVGPICTIPFTVTDGYLLQKGVSLAAVKNTPLNEVYVDEGGQGLADEGFLSGGANAIEATYQYDFAQQIIGNIMDTYRNSAISPASMQGTTENLLKVINQPIYYFRGTTRNPDITIGNRMLIDDKPFTLLVENANLTVNGSLYGQGVYIVKNGTITFTNNSCDEVDVVRGIFATDGGFSTSRIRNDDPAATQRCDGGSLHVDGILIGPGINDTFMNNRRATLNLWSTEQNTDLFINYSEQQLSPTQLQAKKEEKNRRLFEGASVLITTEPGQWDRLAPGAKELFDQLLIKIGN